MQNFAVIRSAVLEKMTFENAIFGKFPDIPELKLSLPFWGKAGCDVVSLYVLQSYRSCIFVSVKPEARRSFGKNLQLRTHSQIIMKSIPTTHCHLSSSRLPSFAMARIASGVNACCHRHVPFGVINACRRHSAASRRKMPNVSPSH